MTHIAKTFRFSFSIESIIKYQRDTPGDWPDYTGKVTQSDILWPTKDIT